MMVTKKFPYLLLVVIMILSMGLAACQPAAPAATPEPVKVEPTAVPVPTATEVPPPPAIGSVDHPIKVLFVPSVDAQAIVSGGEIMAKALKEATGYEFVVSVPTSYAATVEEMCASPTDTIGFIPSLGYVLANQLCAVDPAFMAIRYGSPVYWAEFIVARDSEIKTLEDLAGKTWGIPDTGSTSGYMVPFAMLQEAGIEVGEMVETGGHNQAVKAVYDGSVDFGTVFYTPPLKPEGEAAWVEGEFPDIPDELVESCALNADEKLFCGDWRVLDARANIRTEAPDVIQKVRIIAVSAGIPNDTMSFGPEFPADIRANIETAMVAFAETEAWGESIGNQDFYNWTGIVPATDADFDFVRLMVEATGLTLADY